MPLGSALAEYHRAQRHPDAPVSRAEKSYRNTVYCAHALAVAGGRVTLAQVDGELVSYYCGNRWCLVCNRVRTGRAMNRYLPELETWGDAYFVTLTAPNVPAAQLPTELRRYLDDFTAIKRAMARTHGVKLVAVRKLECTYNAQRDDYHPHFHCVVQGEAAARELHRLWLKQRPDAHHKGQDIQRATPAALRELFKYFTKLVTRSRNKHRQSRAPGQQGASAGETSIAVRVADVAALDVIFQAMRGLRVFQPVGFKLPPVEPAQDENGKIGEGQHTPAPERLRDRAGDHAGELAPQLWRWDQSAADWVNDDAEALAEYTPSDGMRTLVRGIPSPTEDT